MKLPNYETRPSWYRKTLHRLYVFWGLVFGFPLIIYVLNRVSVYILAFAVGFGTLLLIYWGIYRIIRRWK